MSEPGRVSPLGWARRGLRSVLAGDYEVDDRRLGPVTRIKALALAPRDQPQRRMGRSEMEALGRLLNIIPTADDVYVNLSDAEGVTFFGVKSGGDTYTISSSATASAGSTLAVVTRWYENAAADGSAAWTRHAAQAAAAAAVSTAFVVAIHVTAASLPDGHKYVKCASTSTGLVYAVTHDLVTQRTPANLPALGV